MILTTLWKQRLSVLGNVVLLILVIPIVLLANKSIQSAFWLTTVVLMNGGYLLGLGWSKIRIAFPVLVMMVVVIILILTTHSYLSDVLRMPWYLAVYWVATFALSMFNGKRLR